MLAIKLAKTGKTNKKMFRLLISEKSRDPYGRVLEILGSYNPHNKELTVKSERVQYWLEQGAKMTATINNLLLKKKIIKGEKAVASKPGQAKKQKAEKPAAPEKDDEAKEKVVTPETESKPETAPESAPEKSPEEKPSAPESETETSMEKA